MVLHNKKTLLKVFLFQVVLAIGACAFLYANGNSDPRLSSINLDNSDYSGIREAQHGRIQFIKPDQSGTEHENSDPEDLVAEYGEDEYISFKKQSEGGHYLPVISDASLLRSFYQHEPECLPSDKRSNHDSSHKSYLLFRMFRL